MNPRQEVGKGERFEQIVFSRIALAPDRVAIPVCQEQHRRALAAPANLRSADHAGRDVADQQIVFGPARRR